MLSQHFAFLVIFILPQMASLFQKSVAYGLMLACLYDCATAQSRLCGRALADTLDMVCSGRGFHLGKRSGEHFFKYRRNQSSFPEKRSDMDIGKKDFFRLETLLILVVLRKKKIYECCILLISLIEKKCSQTPSLSRELQFTEKSQQPRTIVHGYQVESFTG